MKEAQDRRAAPQTFDIEERLDKTVLEAAGLDGIHREEYLRAVAASEPHLANEARRRITASENLPSSFLDTPAAARLDDLPTEEEEPSPAAALPASERYELGEWLGEGGMGRVLRAFDRQLGRPVALKFLTHEDPAILRLFLTEARAQARVQHPHVLEIYDSGDLRGQPFIAMRYIAGGTLEEAAALSLEQKARLLVQVAEGLHAAHREGLLHRDVKPSNVLVDETPDGELVALVTDFGLAVELADGEATVAGAIAGSPYYIAPERLSGSPATVDRRSDVYSLGVTMYRLFTGHLPFAIQPTVEALRSTLRQELPPPRQVAPALPVELEAIILRCVARQPEQRYSSARAVAAELQRYLDGEVVEAYAAGLAYRLTRFVLRNKLLTGVAATAAAALVVASIAVAVFAVRADAARQRAEMRQGQAEELIRFMVVDLRDKLESLGRLDILGDVGGAATTYFAAVPQEQLSEAELLRHSRMLYQIGDVRIRQGDLAGAAAPMEQSLALAQRLAQLDPDDGERLFELGQSQFWVGFVHWEQGDLAGAREPFEAYLEVSKLLVEMDPANLDWLRELSYAHSNLGSILEAEGKLDKALGQFSFALTLDQKLVLAAPHSRSAQSELAATHNTVAVVLQALGRLGAALEHLRADLEIRRNLVAAEPTNTNGQERLGASHGHLGILLFNQGQVQDAREQFSRMQEISADLVVHDPANTSWRYQLAWSHLDLGRVAFALGDLQAAAGAWRRGGQLFDELVVLDATRQRWQWARAASLFHLALLRQARGEASAMETVKQAVEILEPQAVARPTDLQVHRWLGRGFLLLGTLEDSQDAAKVAFQQAAATLEPFATDTRDGRILAPWAEALRCLGRLREARRVAERLDLLGYREPSLSPRCDPTPET